MKKHPSHPLRLAAIGCGGRSCTYLSLAARDPARYSIVAAADPKSERVERLRVSCGEPSGFLSFQDDNALLAEDRLADVLVIGTQDSYHIQPCLKAMEKGYDILLEKPISPRLEDVLMLERIARELGRRVLVCHVLRYSAFYRKVKELIHAGALGRVVSLNATEGVGTWHHAHSYVRGHWSVVERSSPMILAKSCHDLDLISWFMSEPCERVSSYGGNSLFHAGQAPAGAPDRCADGCPVEKTCSYNALHYMDRYRTWLSYVFDGEHGASAGDMFAWLSHSPWGRCVYRCDNTTVDHQVVAMEFVSGTTATFTMTAFASGRHLEIYGTDATLRGGEAVKSQAGCDIILRRHSDGNEQRIDIHADTGGYDGHGGGDEGLVRALADEMERENADAMTSSLASSVQSHVMAFAAEEARRRGVTVDVAAFQKKHESVFKQVGSL